MRPSEKFEAKAAGQKCSEAWFSPRREHFWPTTQASGFAAGHNRAGYLDRLLIPRAACHTICSDFLPPQKNNLASEFLFLMFLLVSSKQQKPIFI
jgi:hypothetical protein